MAKKSAALAPIKDAQGALLSSNQLVNVQPESTHGLRFFGRTGKVEYIEERGAERGLIDVQFPAVEGYEPAFETIRSTELVVVSAPAAAAPPAGAEHPIEYIPLASIDLVRNTRQSYDEAALVELTESVRQHGVQQNVIVRPHPEVPGRYQLAAGHRRFLASQRAGLATIPAGIRPLTDAHFLEMQLLENLQRQDVHPADEAVVFAEMLEKHGYSPDEIGARVGKSAKFVIQRAKLMSLTAYWMTALRENRLPLAGAYQLAPLPALAQQEATKVYATTGSDGQKRFESEQIRSYIASNILRDLAQVAFPKDDALLYPRAGACLTCPKRSAASTLLFPDLASKDYCLDGGCFARKKELYVARRQQELAEENGHAPVLVSREYTNPPAGAVSCSHWNSTEPNKPGSVLALAVDGANAGQLVHVRLHSSQVVVTPEQQEKAKDARRDEMRAGRVRTLHNLLVAADYYERLANGTPLPEAALLRYCRGEIIRYGGPHRELRAFLVEHFGFKMPPGGTDKMTIGVEQWVNEHLQSLTYAQRLALYFTLLAYNEVANYQGSETLYTYAIAAGTPVATLRPIAIDILEGKVSSPGQQRNLETALQEQFAGKGVASA